MSTIEENLTEIQSRLDGGERDWPEQSLTALIEQMGPAELSDWGADIEMLADKFYPKRRRNLLEIYRKKVGGTGKATTELTRRIPVPAGERLPEPAEILGSASQANFLDVNDHAVSAKIRTLGRIASAVRPGPDSVTAAAHADEYPPFGAQLLQSTSLDLRSFLDDAAAKLRAPEDGR